MGLFDGPVTGVPVDAVLYGSNNEDGFIGPDGEGLDVGLLHEAAADVDDGADDDAGVGAVAGGIDVEDRLLLSPRERRAGDRRTQDDEDRHERAGAHER